MKVNMYTFDKMTLDSVGSFLNSELEVIDQTLHLPLTSVTWHRDFLVRTDITIGDDVSSFTNSTFAAMGGQSAGGKAWAAKRTNGTPSIELDIQKTAQDLPLWAMSVDWTIPELESAMKLGRPVDTQKVMALNLKFNMDVDQHAYIGDSDIGVTGIANRVITNTANALHQDWSTASPTEILDTVFELENSVWEESAWTSAPTKLLIDPVNFNRLRKPLSIGGVNYNSILQYISENSLSLQINGVGLDIQPCKWFASNASTGLSHAVMVAYTPDYDKVRFPITPLQHTPVQYDGLYQKSTYFAKIGALEIPYTSTIGRRVFA